ncbi:PAS domain S-box protein [Baaleninema sp.]|uniref:PAS domain S-box protein n=1 Tax=Baaleninema sp. TaxID=3101197 RepID=UPI003CFEBE51
MTDRAYSVLLSEDDGGLAEALRGLLPSIPHVRYELVWHPGENPATATPSDIYLVKEDRLGELSPLQQRKAIALVDRVEAGLAALEAGAGDYWLRDRLDLGSLEKSLRLLRSRDRNHLYETIFGDLAETVLVTDNEGNLLWVCPNVARIFGYTAEEVMSMKTVGGLLPKNLFDFEDLAKNGELCHLGCSIFDRSGVKHWLIVQVKQLEGDRLSYICRDITEQQKAQQEIDALHQNLERRVRHRTAQLQRLNNTLTREIRHRKQMEAARLESEAKFRGIVECAGVGIGQTNFEGRWIFVNRKLADFLGYAPAELQQTTWQALTHPDDLAADLQWVRQLYAGQIDRYSLEKRFLRRDGTVVWAQIFMTLLRDAAGNPASYIGVFEDINDRKQVEAALQEREREFRTLAENFPDVISRFDRQLRHVYVSPTIERLTGLPVETFIGKTNRELKMPESLVTQWEQSIETVFETQQTQEIEFAWPSPDRVRFFQSRLVPEYDEDGSVRFVMSVTTDISDRKQAEAAIEQLAERLIAVINTVDEGITLSDRQGSFVIFNPPMQEMTGYSLEEANRCQNFLKLLYPEPQAFQEAEAHLDLVVQNGQSRNRETQIRAKDGTRKTLLVSTTVMQFDDREWFLSAYRDISDRKATTEALERERNRLAEAQKLAHVGSWEYDFLTRELSWSEETFRIFGFDPQRHREPTLDEHLQQFQEAHLDRWRAEIHRGLHERRSFDLEISVWRPDGNLRHIYVKGHPIYADDGEPMRLFGTVLDITDRKRYEEKLEESKRFVERIADASPQLLYIFDLEGRRCTYVNQQSLSVLGYAPEVVLERGYDLLRNCVRGEDLPALTPLCDRLQHLQEGEVLEWTFQIQHRDGGDRWLRSRNVAYSHDDSGVTRAILGTATDITEHQQAQLELRRSEARLQTIINSTSDSIVIVDRQGIVQFANPSAARLFGRPLSRLVGLEFGQPIVVGSASELHVIRPGGNLGIAEMNVAETHWDGEAVYVVSLRDITERRQAEEALRDSETKFRQMAENIQDVFWLFAPQTGELLYVSPAYESIWQRSLEELYAMPQSWLDTVYPEDLDRVRLSLALESQGQCGRCEYRIVRPNGELRWIASRTFPIYNERGEVVRTAGVAEDVTDRKRTEAELEGYRTQLEALVAQRTAQLQAANHRLQEEVAQRRQAQARLHFQARLLDVVEHAVIATDLSGAIVYWNRFAERLYGWSLEEVKGCNPNDIISTSDSRDRGQELMERLNRGESWSGEFMVKRRNGREFPALVTTSPIFNEDGKLVGVVGVSIDISERKQAEEALKQTNAELGIVVEQQTRDLAEAIEQLQGELVKRKQAETAFRSQVERERLLAQVQERIRQSLDLDEILETTVAEVQQLLDADRVTVYRHVGNGGFEVVHESRQRNVSSVLGQTIEVAEDGFTPLMQDGRCCNNLFVPVFAVSDPHCRPATEAVWGILCVQQCRRTAAIEPTPFRPWSHADRELLQQVGDRLSIALYQGQLLENEVRYARELARSNRELEQFAYIASHDLQEPLRAVMGFAELLEAEYRDRLDGEALEYLDFIIDGARRMQQLVRDLLAFSRVGTRGKAFALTDCNLVFDRVLSNLHAAIADSQADIERDDLPRIWADESQMVQLFQNLIGNAIKFRGDRTPQIRVTVRLLSDSWEFCVRDNGIGIEPKFFDRVFEVFQRLHTRRQYPGTGIGLAICKKIVERHGGEIWLESSLGEGSAFFFTWRCNPVTPNRVGESATKDGFYPSPPDRLS